MWRIGSQTPPSRMMIEVVAGALTLALATVVERADDGCSAASDGDTLAARVNSASVAANVVIRTRARQFMGSSCAPPIGRTMSMASRWAHGFESLRATYPRQARTAAARLDARGSAIFHDHRLVT